VDQRQHLAPRPRRARPSTEPDGRIDERLDPQPLTERDRQHDPGVDDHPLIIKDDNGSVRQTVHHAGDPLTQDPQPPTRPVLPAQGVISLPPPDRPATKVRWIQAKATETSSPALALDFRCGL